MTLQKSDDPLTWIFKNGPLKGQHMIQVNDETRCWIWQGGKHEGYGRIKIPTRTFPGIRLGSRQRDRDGWLLIKVHQLIYFMRYGNPPPGKELGHICARRSCCFFDHVKPVTPAGNKAEMFMMPELSVLEVDAITEQLLADYPMRYIANEYGVSIWAVRKLARRLGTQLDLIEETPF